MYKKQIPEINASIKKTRKAIISLGCSFVQGQGAVDDELYTDYKWEFVQLGTPLQLNVSKEETEKLLKKYPELSLKPDGKIDWTFMEYKNAFVEVLCKKYFNGEYTPINLGMRGNGNRGTIKELYFYPEVDWDNLDEIIVIYCPSGPERFDFVNDCWHDHARWRCMWPNYKDMEPSPRKLLWEGYAKDLHSEKMVVLEQIAHVQELMNWCKVKNAKLIITPGFDQRYTKEYFKESLMLNIHRDIHGVMDTNASKDPASLDRSVLNYIDLFPWDNVYLPKGYPTFVDLCLFQESGLKKDVHYHFFQYLGTGSPDGWITSCAHPSSKGHDLFAKHLHEHITTNLK